MARKKTKKKAMRRRRGKKEKIRAKKAVPVAPKEEAKKICEEILKQKATFPR